MLWIGLSGGIGSGKSTVAERLSGHGAVVVDADRIAREVVEPGTPGLAQIAERFGPEILDDAGALDRPALGRIVFADEQARRDLEAITHPRIADRTRELVTDASADAVVVHDIPLLVELDRAGDYALTVIVDVPADVRLRRLVDLRGMDEAEARSRIAAQATDEQRILAADVLLDNTGSLEDLRAAVDRLWQERLVPFEENLRHGRHTRRPEQLDIVDPRGGPGSDGPGPGWPARADRILARVRDALGDTVIRADHIGSTAVPGLPAKDVIDLQVVLDDTGVLDDPRVRERLARVGLLVAPGQWWDNEPGRPGSHAWPKRMVATADPAQVLHCHVRAADSPGWRRALLMRDWLRDQAGERAAYADLKAQHLASGISSSDYADAKEPWFGPAFERAEEWARRTGWSA